MFIGRESFFTKYDDNVYAQQFPRKLYAYLKKMHLIDQGKLTVEQLIVEHENKKIEIKIREQHINHGSIFYPVMEFVLIISAQNESQSQQTTIYQFAKQNAFWSGVIDKNVDYPPDYHPSPFLWTDNFFCRQKTTEMVDEIMSLLKKYIPNVPEIVNDSQDGCRIM